MNDSIHINPPRLLRSVKTFTLVELRKWISSCEYLQRNGIEDYNYQSTIQTLLIELKEAKQQLENVSKNLFPNTISPNGTI